MHILYYITPHGFGHAVRSAAICNNLNSDIEVTFRTTIPESFFKEEMTRQFNYCPEAFDCGCIQKDGVTVDIQKTVEAYIQISRENRKKLSTELKFIQEKKIDLIVSDIVPFAFDVAYESDIPSVGISNFNWIDIYDLYKTQEPLYKPIIKEISEQYSKASYLFRMEPSNELKGFSCEEFSIPLVCGNGINRRDELNKIIPQSKGKNIAVIYIGNYGMENVKWENLENFEDWLFLGVYHLPGAPKNFVLMDKSLISYRDLAASVDCVIGKIGYGTTSECSINKTPLIYVPRDDFSEHPILENHLLKNNLGFKCSLMDFQSLEIGRLLDNISTLKEKNTFTSFENGVKVASENLELLLDR